MTLQLNLFSNAIIPSSQTKPILKWAGGKRWLLPELASLWHPHSHRRLVEPFVGGMAVALGLDPEKALLNDTNPHLINLYRWLQRGLVIDVELQYDKVFYNEKRNRFNQIIRTGQQNSREAAILFYYLNRSGFNGLCRFNSRGEFNVPFGSYKDVKYSYDLTSYRTQLSSWEFTLGDFSQIQLSENDFLYADPPYDVVFTTYSAGGFSWSDQQRLAHWLASYDDGPIIASNQATPRILELYGDLGFKIRQLPAPRRISCNGDRNPAIEMLATKGL